MSANTSPKLELLLILEQSQTLSNARNLRQHKCRPMLKLIRRINAVIPCSPYLPHRAFVEFFTLSWAVERWNLSSVSLLLSLLFKLIRENMVIKIIWFLNLRHSFWYVFSHLGSTDISFSSYPLKAKYVELMGKHKGYNSSHVYCQVKGWSKKSCKIFSNDFGKGFWNGMMEGEKMDSRKNILMLKYFSPLKILTSPFYLQRLFELFFFLLFYSILSLSLSLSFSMLHLFEDLGI
jgi:hypothetical protein